MRTVGRNTVRHKGLVGATQGWWLTRGRFSTPHGIIDGAVKISRGRIAAIRPRAPRGARTIDVRGAYVAPGFIDLHVWGEPARLSRELPSGGTTAFLATVGPESPSALVEKLPAVSGPLHAIRDTLNGATCLGIHLEGPFLNPVRGGALPKRWMRSPTLRELERLRRSSRERLRLITLAPELRGARPAIAWCRRHRIAVSLGHSDADAAIATRAVDEGARAVTHVFNGMRPFHHRRPSLLDVALTDPRLTAMAILDGTHISPTAFRLLVGAKGPSRVALVTDAVGRAGWDVVARGGALYRRDGTLAGSSLTMMRAVANAVRFGNVPLPDAVRMATEVPARLLGDRSRGTLAPGRRADLVVFDGRFRVTMTLIGGRIVYQRRK